MGDNAYTLLELLDLALCVPEIGAVNFNILHSVIKTLIKELNMQSIRTTCRIARNSLADGFLKGRKQQPKKQRELPEITGTSRSVDPSHLTPTVDSEDESEEKASGFPALQPTTDEEVQDDSEHLLQKSTESRDLLLPQTQRFNPQREGTDDVQEDTLYEELSRREDFHEIPQENESRVERQDRYREKEMGFTESWRDTNTQRRLEAAEEGIERLSKAVDQLFDYFDQLNQATHEMQQGMKDMEAHLQVLDDTAAIKVPIDAEAKLVTDEAPKSDDYLPSTLSSDSLSLKRVDSGAAVAGVTSEKDLPSLAEDTVYSTDEFERRRTAAADKTDKTTDVCAMIDVPPIEEIWKEIQELQKRKMDIVKFPGGSIETFFSESQSFKSEMQERMTDVFNRLRELEKLRESFEKIISDKEKFEKLLSLVEKELPSSSDQFVSGKALTQDLNERFEDVWQELSQISSKLAKLSGDEDIYGTTLDLQRMVRKQNDALESLWKKFEIFDTEQKHKKKILNKIQNSLNQLSHSKVDQDEFNDAINLKADRRDLELKIDKEEFDYAIEDIGAALREIFEKIEALEKALEKAREDLFDELGLKLNISDYEKMEMLVMNRLRSIMYAFKHLKSLLMSSLFPEAGAITKCMCCGRSADIMGAKFAEGGDVGPHEPRFLKDDYTLDDLRLSNGRCKQSERSPSSSRSAPARSNQMDASTIDMKNEQKLDTEYVDFLKTTGDIGDERNLNLDSSLVKSSTGKQTRKTHQTDAITPQESPVKDASDRSRDYKGIKILSESMRGELIFTRMSCRSFSLKSKDGTVYEPSQEISEKRTAIASSAARKQSSKVSISDGRQRKVNVVSIPVNDIPLDNHRRSSVFNTPSNESKELRRSRESSARVCAKYPTLSRKSTK